MNFLDGDGKRVGTASIQSPTIAAFNANAVEVMGNAARNAPGETYYAQPKCHDPSGDDSNVTFTRKTVRLSSYQDDAIKDAVETWADAVPELN